MDPAGLLFFITLIVPESSIPVFRRDFYDTAVYILNIYFGIL